MKYIRELSKIIVNAVARKTKVAAKLTTINGDVFYGVNVESSCHSLSVCAERAALFNAITSLGGGLKILEVEVYALREDEPIDIIPCGACRQLISEYSFEDTVLAGKKIGEWFPYPYK